MKYSIEEKALADIMTYLSYRPYREVRELIDMIEKSAKPIEAEKPKEETEDGNKII